MRDLSSPNHGLNLATATNNSDDAEDGTDFLHAGNPSKSSLRIYLLVTHFADGDKRGSERV